MAEMVRLACPGGWVTSQEPDVGCSLRHPPLLAWTEWSTCSSRLVRAGVDFRIGRRLTGLFREAGLEDVRVTMHAGSHPAGHSRSQLAMRAEFVLTSDPSTAHLPADTAGTATSFTIFEGTSEIQRMIIGRAVTGLDVR
jgi:hypothetical protein